MIEARFEKSEPLDGEEICSTFKYGIYLLIGYPYYVLQSMLTYGREADRPWLIYKCE